MKFKNTKVYGLSESIIRSGYPMQIGEPDDLEEAVVDLKYWFKHKYFWDIIDILEYQPTSSKWSSSEWSKYNQNEIKLSEEYNCALIVIRNSFGEIIKDIKIDYEDIIKLYKFKLSKSHNYITLSKKGDANDKESLHRFLLNAKKGEIVDHINRNKDDYRKYNLRKTNYSGNNINRSTNNNNVLGVFYRKDRNKWFSRLTLNKKIISLGTFESFDSAVKARLEGELLYYKELSPQLHLLEKYGYKNPYPDLIKDFEEIPNLAKAYKQYKRITSLSKVKSGTGHDCALKGIHVSFDLQYPEYFSPQLQRYNWIDIVSSQSKMHRITSKKLTKSDFTPSTHQSFISSVNKDIKRYNDPNFKDMKSHFFRCIISNLPSGYLKWMGISTNYLQLKTIWNQRCRIKHKLVEWQEFGEWIKTLPMSELITGLNE